MNFVLKHFASGHALFAGAAILVLAVGVGTLDRERTRRVFTRLTALIGLIVIGMSAAPLPRWLYFVWFPLVFVWLFLGERVGERRARAALATAVAVGLLSILAVGLELPRHFAPEIRPGDYESVYIIGDSITSGIGEKETWPDFYAAQCPVQVVDLSRAGETVESALSMTGDMTSSNALVILEIGGNDMLESAAGEKFEADLDALLGEVCAPGRTVIMLELPLLFMKNRFGRVQRSLARKYEVALIPKRRFAAVLTAKDATVDGLHLSAAGHERMARMMWESTASAFCAE